MAEPSDTSDLLKLLSEIRKSDTAAAPEEGLRLIRAFLRLSNAQDRTAAINYVEQLADNKGHH